MSPQSKTFVPPGGIAHTPAEPFTAKAGGNPVKSVRGGGRAEPSVTFDMYDDKELLVVARGHIGILTRPLTVRRVVFEARAGVVVGRRVKQEFFSRRAGGITFPVKLLPYAIEPLIEAGGRVSSTRNLEVALKGYSAGLFRSGLVYGVCRDQARGLIARNLRAMDGGSAAILVCNRDEVARWGRDVGWWLADCPRPPRVIVLTSQRMRASGPLDGGTIIVPRADYLRGTIDRPPRDMYEYFSEPNLDLLPASCVCIGYAESPAAPSPGELLTLRRYFVRVNRASAPRGRDVVVRRLPIPCPVDLARRDASTCLDACRAVWTDPARNAVIAKAAVAAAAGVGPQGTVAVVVATPEHAAALAAHLSAWLVVTRGAAGGTTSRAIYTSAAFDDGLPTADVIVDARRAGPVPERWFDDLPGSPRACAVLIDVVDSAPPAARRKASGRAQTYGDRGWKIDGVNGGEEVLRVV